ncbi:MAG TPA: hypothetical protein PK544_04060 [Spirochaetota bacterium]|nr:hypothetical protein [Spirochaetota bacterium]
MIRNRYLSLLLSLFFFAGVLAVTGCSGSSIEILSLTGATAKAFSVPVPEGVTLTVNGEVKQEYSFSGRALNGFATTILRTQEVSPSGEFEGTYTYVGIPLYFMLEGIAPKKPKDAAFDRPLDMVVTFTSKDGKKVHFSYGELTMTDDTHPVILAYNRKQLLPSDEKTAKSYTHNKHKSNVTGLRVVCTGDPDTARYLDNVTTITLRTPKVPFENLPVMVRGKKCSSDGITCVSKSGTAPVRLTGVKKVRAQKWIRVGHGRGFKGISTAAGYDLRDLLVKNFPGCSPEKYFLFIACDGYRTIFSGREIFLTEHGKSMTILETLNGKRLPNGPMLGPIKDYFVDRDVWGLSHIVMLDSI